MRTSPHRSRSGRRSRRSRRPVHTIRRSSRRKTRSKRNSRSRTNRRYRSGGLFKHILTPPPEGEIREWFKQSKTFVDEFASGEKDKFEQALELLNVTLKQARSDLRVHIAETDEWMERLRHPTVTVVTTSGERNISLEGHCCWGVEFQVDEQNVMVKTVVEDYPFHKAGITVKDIIKDIHPGKERTPDDSLQGQRLGRVNDVLTAMCVRLMPSEETKSD